MNVQTLDQVLTAADAVIRLPKSAMQIYELAQDPETDFGEIVSAVETDPAFAARLLQLANSATYSRGVPVNDLGFAIARVGKREIAQLALMLAAAAEFSKLESELLQLSSFWRHSLTTAVLARKITRLQGWGGNDVFCAGLLHDLGQLVLFHTSPLVMKEVLENALDTDDESIVITENRVFGFDHTQVGEKLAENWAFPPALVATIRHHHDPENAKHYQHVVATVAIANALEACEITSENSLAEIPANIREMVDSMLGTDFKLDFELLSESRAEALELLALF